MLEKPRIANTTKPRTDDLTVDLESAEGFRQMVRLMDLRDLRGAEFRRLLLLAHNEGLLAELLQEVADAAAQAGHHPRPLGVLAEPTGQKIPPIQ